MDNRDNQNRMRIKKSTTKRTVIIVVAIIAIVLSGIGAAVVIRNNQVVKESTKQRDKAKQSTNSKDDSSSTKQSDDKTTSDGNNSGSGSNTATDGKQPARHEGDNAQDSQSLTGNIGTFAISGDKLLVRVTVNQYISDANGTCQLTLTGPAGQTYANQAKLIANPQTSTCYGWDIAVSELGNVSGHWSIVVVLSGGGKTGTLTKQADL